MKLLMIDNYDSFTYNLVQLLTVAGAELEVVRNDREGVDALLGREVGGIVISPGPGRPEDAGVCLELLGRRPDLPILGVCLGHQAMGAAWGATVRRADRLMHGKTSPVNHGGSPLFEGLSDPFEATRYHSLDLDPDTLPEEWERTAWADDGSLMAMAHRELPYYGVQFHPESVLTRSGPVLLANFLRLCEAHAAGSVPATDSKAAPPTDPATEETHP